MKISIVTATYNRAHLLPNLYNSIQKNYDNYDNVEWIIVDDGSKDDTKKVVNKWIKENKFDIKYYYQENQGKMNAINNGINYVTGDIVIEIDSDDYLCNNIFKEIVKDFKKIKKENVYGVLYKKRLVGYNNKVDKKINNKKIRLYDIHNKYGYDFDMCIAFKSDVRKKYSYELENNEKFITEARMYYKMDNDSEGLLFRDKEIIVSEYMQDGYSKNIQEIFIKYPYGYYKYFKEALSYTHKQIMFKKRIYLIKHFILFGYLTKKNRLELLKDVDGINKLLVVLLVIPGYLKSRIFALKNNI